MLQWTGLAPGTLPQWGALVAIIAGVLIWWIKTGPERGRVANERKQIDITEMDKVLADYAKQIAEFRKEVHGYKNEVQAVRGELWASERLSSQRNNWNSDMVFIIELLISELERLDPKSAIVKQAKAMIKRMGVDDPNKSDALNTAETAVRDAKQTVRSTEHAVDEINATEAIKGGGK